MAGLRLTGATVLISLAFLSFGCGASSQNNPAPAAPAPTTPATPPTGLTPTTTPTTAPTSKQPTQPVQPVQPAAPTALSADFATNCAMCHGPAGLGVGTFYPNLTVVPTLATYTSFVRSGGGGMPAFTTSTYTDADAQADFTFLTKK